MHYALLLSVTIRDQCSSTQRGRLMVISEIRRLNLVSHIAKNFEGNRAAFCRATGKNPNLINLVLTDNPDYRRNIGEKLARSIEAVAGLPVGWLDSPRGIGDRRTTSIPILFNPWLIPDKPPIKGDSMLTIPTDDPLLKFRTSATANLLIVASQENSMHPTIKVRDHVWVDLGVKAFTANGIYVVRGADDTTAFKRIQQLSDSQFQLSVDDKSYEPLLLTTKTMSKTTIVGRVTCVWSIALM